MTRFVAAPLLVVLGAVTVICTVALHSSLLGWMLGAAASIVTVSVLPGGWFYRPPFALGWVGVGMVILQGRPEGDFLVSNDTYGSLLLGVGGAVVAFTVFGLARPPERAGSGSAQTPA